MDVVIDLVVYEFMSMSADEVFEFMLEFHIDFNWLRSWKIVISGLVFSLNIQIIISHIIKFDLNALKIYRIKHRTS